MYQLLVLGTAAMSATQTRNQNGHLLRWGREAILFDPGEGMQRQLTAAGASFARITRICITHFHGDHCLGLPGVLQRRAVDPDPGPLDIYYPRAGHERLLRLIDATDWDVDSVELRLHPADDGARFELGDDTTLHARMLDHPVATVGWRVEQHDRRHFLTDRLQELGISGADIGLLREHGWIEVGDRRVHVDDVSEHRPGRCLAFVMDTRPCAAALDLARGADVLVCEATYLERDAAIAVQGGHLTALDAARIARDAGVLLLVLTHFSERYDDAQALAREARLVFPDVIAADDLARIDLPARGNAPHGSQAGEQPG